MIVTLDTRIYYYHYYLSSYLFIFFPISDLGDLKAKCQISVAQGLRQHQFIETFMITLFTSERFEW